LAQSLSEIEGSLLVATTVLRQAIEDVSTELAQGGIQVSSLDQATTQALVPASPFTQRLMHYSGLIQSHALELLSILPMPPAEAATGSSEAQESPVSSAPTGRNGSFRSRDFRALEDHEHEPPYDSIVLDGIGDVWQRDTNGWNCATPARSFHGWEWSRLRNEYGDIRLIRFGS
jgi:hypothetical protein